MPYRVNILLFVIVAVVVIFVTLYETITFFPYLNKKTPNQGLS